MNWRACSLLLLFVGLPAAAAERFQVTFGSTLPPWYQGLALTSPTQSTHDKKEADWVYGMHGRLYGDYTTAAAHTPAGIPGDGGWSAEMDFTRRFLKDETAADYWGLNFAVGYDNWRSRSADGAGTLGYDQHYGVGFGRLGAVLHSARYGLSLQGGVKLPFYASEYVDMSSSGANDLSLTPRADYSLYASVDYRVTERWKLGGYFDSYRFKPSDIIPLTVGGVPAGAESYQSKGQQGRIGIYLDYRF